MSEVDAIASRMLDRGITLWCENGEIHYRDDRGDITEQDIALLRHMKADLLLFLEQRMSTALRDSPIVRRRPDEKVPLTFAQMSSWKSLVRFGMRRNIRSVAKAMRIEGELDVASLTRAFSHMIGRHEILRMRVVPDVTLPTQEEIPNGRFELEFVEASGQCLEERERNLKLLADGLANENCDVTVGPLIKARLVRNTPIDHVFIVAIDHIVADGVSMGIVMRDIWITYMHYLRGSALALPRIDLQFADYAVWENNINTRWWKSHGEYWESSLACDPCTKIFNDEERGPGEKLRTKVVGIALSKEVTQQLRLLAQRQRTTLVMITLATYLGLIAKWSQNSDVMLALILAGRQRKELVNAVGLFAFKTHLRISVDPAAPFLEFLRLTCAEYSKVHMHQCYGRFALNWPDREYTKTPVFNFHARIKEYAQAANKIVRAAPSVRGSMRLKYFPISKSHYETDWDEDLAALDGEPETELHESRGGIAGNILYSEHRADAGFMQRFATSYEAAATAVANNPLQFVGNLPCYR
jgi:Condensation domain/TubC N-terminal docking domain